MTSLNIHLGDFRGAAIWDDPIDHIITDPPYEREMHATRKDKRAMRLDGGRVSPDLDFAPITDEDRADLCRAAKEACQGWALIFSTIEGVAAWRDAIQSAGLKYKRAMPWVKPDSAPQFNGQGPAHCCEIIIAAWCGSGYSRWNGGGGRGEYRICVNPPDRDGRHPTEKPLDLMSALTLQFSKPGELICDPFMGGGSTGVAARSLGRGFAGAEIDPAYFAVAQSRLGVPPADISELGPLFAKRQGAA